jgi:transposase
VDREALRDRALQWGGVGTAVGLDVSKEEIVACVRWPGAQFERPWRIGNPDQIEELLELVTLLRTTCGSMTVGMESTGTYGDAVRRALTLGRVEVHRISGKASRDYQEIFDGVPSQHDGKDAAVIAELTAFGKGTAWPYQEESQRQAEARRQVARAESYREQQTQWTGRLESLLARHWPELSSLLALESVTLLEMLVHYRSPARVAADAGAGARLAGWGGPQLKASKIAQVLASARATQGLPVSEPQGAWLEEVASNVLSALRQVQDANRQLTALVAAEPGLSRYAMIGAPTLAAIWVHAGDPRDYGSGGALLKALGLNLKERSSGRRVGELAISKRGSSRARRWLYFWALRAIQREELREWYAQFIRVGRSSSEAGKQEHRKMKGVVAVMRKLARGLRHAMIHEEEFDYGKLFAPSARPRRRRKRRRRTATT